MENFLSRCLLCTCTPDVTPNLHIFSAAGNQLQLAEKIKKYLNMQIVAELPQNVCHSCIAKLEVTHELVTSSQQASITLLQIKQQSGNFGQEAEQENSECSTTELKSHQPATQSAVINMDTKTHEAGKMILDKTKTATTPTFSSKLRKAIEKDYGGEVTCDICSKKVKHKFCLIQHKNQKHNMNLPFDCQHCGAKCSTLINIIQHVAKSKSCDNPEKLFPITSKKLLRDETFQPVNCGICNFTSKNKFSLLRHINSEHLDVVVVPLPFCCELCDKEVSSYQSLLRHLRDMHTPKTQCGHCDKFIATNKMSTHLKLHQNHIQQSNTKDTTEDIQVKMEPSEEILTSDFTIEEHEIKQEPQGDQMDILPWIADVEPQMESTERRTSHFLQCDSCCFSTDNKMELSAHMQTHQTTNTADIPPRKRRCYSKRNSRILMCPECGLYYSYPEILAWHMNHCHGTDAIVSVFKVNDTQHSYRCLICATVFRTFTFVVSHLSSQHRITDLPYKCSSCGKTFVLRGQLKRHGLKCEIHGECISSVIAVKGAKCKLCGKVCKSEIQLNNHISTFHALKSQSYKCIHCDETFRFFPPLKLHCLDKHPGKSIVQCELCEGHEFKSYQGYRLHKTSKHPTQVL